MDKPKIELKKVKTFIGNEGHGLNAEVWVDGIKTAYVIDDASGSIMYDFTVYDKVKFKQLEEYVDSLPHEPMIIEGKPFERDGKVVMHEPRIEDVIDEVFTEMQTAKAMKKLEKKFVNHLVWGNKKFNGNYSYVKYPRPLSEYSRLALQKAVDLRKETFEPDEVFYNTNFESLNIKI